MAPISIRTVEKSYGAVQVIHGVSLDIADGEFVILVGPSGCGKSTLLRMIAGLESISGGEVAIGDKVVNRLPPRERDIAMVFQSYALYPHMSVADNMGFSLKLARRPKEEIAQAVDAAADILDLRPLLQRKPAQLSGGQRQRVAMGRAIVRNPEVFLFDEPLSNLDAKLRVAMRSQIKGLHQRLKTTTVYVTHDQVEAMTMADRIVVMNAGIIEQVGTPMELYDKPNTMFVAGFIGSPAMNFLNGTIARKGDTVTFIADDNTATALDPALTNAKDGHDVVMGIRPEHLFIVDSPDERTSLNAEVVLVEPTGSETLVITKCAGQELMVLLRERRSISVGQNLHLSFASSAVHLFNKPDGLRL